MTIYVSYNKETEVVTVSSDIQDVAPLELNNNSVINTSSNLSFEIAVNTSIYEQINSVDQPFIDIQPE